MQSSEVFVMIENREKCTNCKYNRSTNTTNTGNGNNTYIYQSIEVTCAAEKDTIVNK